MIAALLKWTGLSQWMMELIALGAVAGAVWLWHHETFESGVKTEVAKVEAVNAKVTAALTTKANTAEHSHDDELTALRAFRDSHPVDQPVRLCGDPTPGVQAPATQPVSSGTVATASGVQPVPSRDSGVRAQPGPDIAGLLEALAARADQVTAQARELQTRDTP